MVYNSRSLLAFQVISCSVARRSYIVAFVVVAFCLAGCSTERKAASDNDLKTASDSSDSRLPVTGVAVVPLQFPEFTSVTAQYAGSQSCVECHQDVHDEYANHPMAKSTARIESDGDSGQNESVGFTAPTGRSYKVTSSKDGSVAHHECVFDSNGEIIYDQSVDVAFVMGSGVHGKSYLYESNGRLMQSPISWYAGSNQWDLSPGYEGPANPRFERLVAHDCLHCHVGETNVVSGERYSVKKPAFGELGIGCERCHGPAQDHVDYSRISDIERSGADPILKLQSLSLDRLDAVCLQCHMQGARRIPHSGASETSFRPGMAMNDVWTLFLKSPADDQLPIVSHGEQMHQSKCYQESGEMTCVTCHSPHSRPELSTEVDWYRGQCLTCHEQEGDVECAMNLEERLQKSPEDSCVQCHMPAASAQNVPHTAHTNHMIPRMESGRAVSEDRPADVLEESSHSPNKANRQRARGIFMAETAYSAGDKSMAMKALAMLQPVMVAKPDDFEAAEAVGRAAETLGDLKSAMKAWQQGLRSSPDDELLLLLLATAQHAANDFENAEVSYRRLMKINPARSLYPGRLTHILGMRQKYSESMRTAELALKLNPSLVQAHQWLAMAYERQGNAVKSKYHQDMIQKLRKAFHF